MKTRPFPCSQGRVALRDGRTMFVADAHKDGVRLIAHAEYLETALLELKVQALRQTAHAN